MTLDKGERVIELGPYKTLGRAMLTGLHVYHEWTMPPRLRRKYRHLLEDPREVLEHCGDDRIDAEWSAGAEDSLQQHVRKLGYEFRQPDESRSARHAHSTQSTSEQVATTGFSRMIGHGRIPVQDTCGSS